MNRQMPSSCSRIYRACFYRNTSSLVGFSFFMRRNAWELKNYSTEPRAGTPVKSLKALSFKQPTEGNDSKVNSNNISRKVNTDDFAETKLIHGNTDLRIAISPKALNKLTSISSQDNDYNTALKISVESGGCHGFQYNLKLTNLQKELSENNDMLVFARDGGDAGKAYIMLDDSSLEILQESKIDYVKELIGSQFKVVDSPYTSTACGCGASFDFDFDRLQRDKEARK